MKRIIVSICIVIVLFVGVLFTVRALREPKPGKTKNNPKDGAVMVRVPAGEFLMGSDDRQEDENPQHTVYLDGYWMYKYEVNVAQYRQNVWIFSERDR